MSGKIWLGDLTLQAQAVARDKSLPSGEYDTNISDPRTHLIDRRAFAEAAFKFLPVRARLDIAGFGEDDIFSH